MNECTCVGDKCDLAADDWRHGTLGGYTNHKCRCALCRFTASERQREFKKRNPHYYRSDQVNQRRERRNPNYQGRKRQPGQWWGTQEAIAVVQLKTLLQPLVELNGNVWLAKQIGVDESRVRAVFKQKFITVPVVDKWLTALGLTHALYDSSLTVVSNPYYERDTDC